jgi:hypothetical protein
VRQTTPADSTPDLRDAPALSPTQRPVQLLPVTGSAAARSAGKIRVCVLCGHSLVAGQRVVRVHGSTLHARCCSTGRRD